MTSNESGSTVNLRQQYTQYTTCSIYFLFLLLHFEGAAGGILLNCFTTNIALPTVDTSVNVSCTSVAFSNVTVQGSMTLNINISGFVAANPGSPKILLTISNLTVRAGATLMIDSRECRVNVTSRPTVSIAIQSLIGTDGCLVFLGSFPAGTSIFVSGARMTSSTVAAPMLPTLDPYFPGSYHKMIALVDVSLTGNSSMIFVNCSLSSSSNIKTLSFFATGTLPITFSAGSILVLLNCTMSTAGRSSDSFYTSCPVIFTNSSYLAVISGTLLGQYSVFIDSPATFTDSSNFVLASCNLISENGGGTAAFLMSSTVTFTNSSYLAFTSCILTSSLYALYMSSAGAFSNASFLAVTNCTMIAGAAGGDAFYISTHTFSSCSFLVVTSCSITGGSLAIYVGMMTIDGWSYVVVTNSSLTTTTSSSYPPVTLGYNSPLIIANSSWVLWKGNSISSVPGYGSCIQNSITFSSVTPMPGSISILDNTCSCGQGCSLWAASTVSNGAQGKVYQRCNIVNGAPVNPGSALVPTGSIFAGGCGSCNASADCFAPLTFSNSTCSIDASRGSANVSVCQCLPGGLSSNMCLPLLFMPPWQTAKGLTTATFSRVITASESISRSDLSFRSATSESGSATRTIKTSVSESTVSIWTPTSNTMFKTESFSSSRSISSVGEQETLTRSESNSAVTASRTSITPSASCSRPSSGSSVNSVSISLSTFVCILHPADVLQNITLVVYSAAPLGANSTGAGDEGIVTVPMGATVPMLSVLAAVSLRINFLATADFRFAQPTRMTVTLGEIVRTVWGNASVSIYVSTVNVKLGELSASSATRFAASADVGVSPPKGTPCPTRNVTIAFECMLAPLRTPSELKSTVEATYWVSTALSSVLGNPVTAMSNTGMVSILTLKECVFSDIDPLDASVSPIPLALGGAVGQYYRGGVVIAVAINIGYFSLALLSAIVTPNLITSRKRPGDLLGLLRFPSSLMIFAGIFHQGMVSSSVSLLRLANNPLDVLLGSCGLVSATCLTVFMLLAGTRWRQCHVEDRCERDMYSSVKVVQLFLNLALWKQHWVDNLQDDGAPSGYKRRYLFILDDMAAGYWTATELVSGLAQGTILGIRKNDLRACQVQRLVLAVHSFVMASAAIIIRPCGSFFGNMFLIASKLGSFVVALLIVIHTVLGSESAYQNSETATAGFTFVSSLQTAIQVLLLLVLSRKSLLMFVQSLLRRRVHGTSSDDAHVSSQEPLQELLLDDLICDDVSSDEVQLDHYETKDEEAMGIILATGEDETEDAVEEDQLDPKVARKQARKEKKRQAIVKFLEEGSRSFEKKSTERGKDVPPRARRADGTDRRRTASFHILPQKSVDAHFYSSGISSLILGSDAVEE